MPRYFDKVPNRIRDSIDKRRDEYREFLIDQKKLRDFRAFHVKPQRIDEITFMDPLPSWDGLKELNPVVAWILRRIYDPNIEQNCMMMINGQTGSGKSYSAIGLGLLTDANFDVDSVCFSLREMRDMVDAGRKTIVLDDCETYAHSRDSMTKTSKWLAKYFDMARAKRNFFIMTAPSFFEVEKVIRDRTIIRGETKGVNPIGQETIMKTHFIEKDPNEGKIYKHLPIIWDNEESIFKRINDIRIKKPKDAIIKAYKDKKIDRFHKLGKKLDTIEKKDEFAESGDGKNNNESKRPWYKICTDEYLDEGLSLQEISERHGVPIEKVRMGLVNAKRLGYRAKELNDIC